MNTLRRWAARYPDDPYPGTWIQTGTPTPIRVVFEDTVVYTIVFNITDDWVGRLLPNKRGKYLFVKTIPGTHGRSLAAWVGDSHGFGEEVIANAAPRIRTTDFTFPDPVKTTSQQVIDTSRANPTGTVGSKVGSSYGRIWRPAWGATYRDPIYNCEEDGTSSKLTEYYQISRSVPRGDTWQQIYPPSNLLVPSHTQKAHNTARTQVQRESRENHTCSDTAASAINNLEAIVAPSSPRTLASSATTTLDTSQPDPCRTTIKRSRSPHLETVLNPSSKRIARDHNAVVFHFSIPLPEGEVPVPGSKPDFIPVPLERVRQRAISSSPTPKLAWEMGRESADGMAFKGVRCEWDDGAKKKSVVP